MRNFDIEVVIVDQKLELEELRKVMNTLNGVIMPGGDISLYNLSNRIVIDNGEPIITETYTLAPLMVFFQNVHKVANEINTKRRFPLWGSCLSSEAIAILETNHKLKLQDVGNEAMQDLNIKILPGTGFNAYMDDTPDIKKSAQHDK